MTRSAASDTALDEALEVLDDAAPHYPPLEFANHGPMAVDALAHLGRSDDVVPWAVAYRKNLRAAPPPGVAVDADDWARNLGELGRFADWEARFTLELAEEPWPAVVTRWVPRLAPGLSADALHGPIRVGHAVRSLEAAENPLRRRELARGLALWASTYLALPGTADDPEKGTTLSPAQAVRQVRRITDEERGDIFSIVGGLVALHGVEDFGPVISMVDPRPDPAGFLADLGATFAQVALEQVHDRLTAVIFTHTITGPAALGLLFPYLSSTEQAAAASYAWQAAAGVYAALGSDPRPAGGDPAIPATDELVDRAVATGDEHAIKLTEACLRLDDGSGTHLAAAALGVAAFEAG